MKNILILVNHPDDEVLSFGGLIKKSIDKGYNVHIHYFCVGGPCSNVSADIRLKELTEVAKFYGFSYSYDERKLDGILSTIPSTEITGIIDKLINHYRPDEVYCNSTSEHADHKALYEAFLGAARLKSGYMPKLFAIGTYPFSDQLYTEPFGGKIFNPLHISIENFKIDSFSLYESQHKVSPSPLELRGLELLDKYNGLMCGSEYAELYYQLRYIRS